MLRCPFPPNVCKYAVGQMGTWKKWTFGGKEYPKCFKGVSQVPYVHYPELFKNGHWSKWALGANGHLGKEYPKCPVPIPQFFQIGIWGPSAHLPLCPFCPSVHLGKMSTIKVFLSPKGPLFPKTPSANFSLCPFANILGE